MAQPRSSEGAESDPPASAAATPAAKLFSLPRQVLETNHPGNIAGIEAFLAMVVKLAGAQAGAIRALTHDGEYLRLVAAVGTDEDFLQRELLVGVCGVCGDAVRDDDIRASSDDRSCPQLSPCTMRSNGFGHVIAVPLEHKGEPVGVFNLFFGSAEASPSQIKPLLRPIGQLLGLTLENAALERENARAALLAERQTMAADIHDSLAQTLAFARMRLPLLEDAVRAADSERSLRYCNDLAGELSRAHRGLRGLITHFRAGMDARGLKRGLRDVVMRFRESSGVALDFDNQVPDLCLPVEAEVQVFFIVQEALANVRKHAKATRARLAVDKVADGVEILIEDNGCGHISDPAVLRISAIAAASYGLRIMRERAQRFGGRVSFENLPKGGVRVRVFVPDRGVDG